MSDDKAETPKQQHWAEAVAECITDEQEALRIVGMYEDGEWQPEMLNIGRENLTLKRDLAAAQERVAELEAFLDAVERQYDDELTPGQLADRLYETSCRARALLAPPQEPR